MSRFARLIRAILLCAAIVAFATIAAADPSEADPDLATRDEDYAAGRGAVEKKEWAEAVRFSSARRRAILITRTCRTSSAILTAT